MTSLLQTHNGNYCDGLQIFVVVLEYHFLFFCLFVSDRCLRVVGQIVILLWFKGSKQNEKNAQCFETKTGGNH